MTGVLSVPDETSTKFQSNSALDDNKNDEYKPTNEVKEERVSNLSFNLDGDPITSDEDNILAKDSFWGRLYFNDFPQRKGIQYFRGHFGSEPPRGEITFLLREPYTLCGSIIGNNEIQGNGKKFLVAMRGECPFGEKVRVANEAGVDGLVIVNNEEGNFHIWSNHSADFEHISVSMISKHLGQRLLQEFSKSSAVNGRFVPMRCGTGNTQESENYCREIYESDRSFVNHLNFTGTLKASDKVEFPFLQADFGPKLNKRDIKVVKLEDDFDDCILGDFMGSDLFADKAVLVFRGNCDFGTKAEVLSSSGAAVMLLTNDDNEGDSTIFTMGIDSETRGSQINIPALMISKKAGNHLMKLMTEGRDEVMLS